MKLSRNVRRLMRTHAEAVARDLARTCLDFNAAGKLEPVRDARAVAALERAFLAMARNGGEPAVIAISEDAASAFPRQQPSNGGALVKPWLAVGLDQAGLATYAMRRIFALGLSEAEERDLAEVTMLAELGLALNVAGFPVQAKRRA